MTEKGAAAKGKSAGKPRLRRLLQAASLCVVATLGPLAIVRNSRGIVPLLEVDGEESGQVGNQRQLEVELSGTLRGGGGRSGSAAVAKVDDGFHCPYQQLGLLWMHPTKAGDTPLDTAMRDGPCGRYDQEMYRAREDYHWLGVGIQKGGTTTLFTRLYGHPASFMGDKEMRFFLDPDLNVMNPELAKRKYADEHWWYTYKVEPGKRRGEITPNYQTQIRVAERVRRILGSPQRFVMVLRDPVERAYSFYQMALRLKMKVVENYHSFEHFIEDEYKLIMKCREQHYWSLTWYTQCYTKAMRWIGPLGHGMYYEHLMMWWEHYPPCSMLVIDQKDLNIEGVDSCLYAFLDMQPYQFELPASSRNYSGDWMMSEKYNKEDPMLEPTRLSLQSLFRPHNEKLESLLGRKFDWY